MPSAPLSKFAAKTAQEICARFQLAEPARALLKPGIAPAPYLDALLEKQHFEDATRFLAHGLPKREAVWWACLCAKQSNPAGVAAAAIKAAERWVNDPSEENRQAAMPAAQQAQFGTPAGCAALATFFSGGSLGPPDVPAIAPAETLTSDAVAGTVMLAVVAKDPQNAPQRYREFLTRGVEIANGKSLWK